MGRLTERSRLDSRVQIQRRVNTTGADGGVTQNWVTEDTRWADVRAVRGDEREQGNTVNEMRTHVVRMRYHDSLNAQYRILSGDLVLNIVGVLHDPERKRFTTAHCQEVV